MRLIQRFIPIALLAHAISFVAVAQSLPAITSISPNTAVAGGPAFTLTVNGAGFFGCDLAPCPLGVDWQPPSGSPTFIAGTANGNGTQMTASIPASLIATAGTATVTVEAENTTSNSVTFTITPPPPAITSLSPPSATAGGPAFTLTVNGSNFVQCSAAPCLGITWQPSSGGSTFLAGSPNGSGTQMTVAIAASLIASPGTALVGVTAAGGTNPAAGDALFDITEPPPVIASLTPSSATAGGPAFTLTVNGSNFVDFVCARTCAGFGIYWQPASGGSTYLGGTVNANGTQLTATVPANLIAAVGTAGVSVQALGGASNSVTFTINSPTPTIASIAPASTLAGGPAFALTVNGSGFLQCAVLCLGINWQPSSGGSTFIAGTANSNGTQLTATVPANLIATVGTASVSVQALGGASNSVTFTISSPTPTIASIAPTSAPAGSAPITLTLTGAGYTASTVVQYGGVALPTSFVSATQVTAAVSASLLSNPGSALVTAANGTAVSLPIAFHVTGPSISSLSPSSTTAGSPQFTLTVNGSSFVPASIVLWSGAPLATTFVSATQLQGVVPASLVAHTGTATITVSNTPTAVSGAATFTIGAPPPAIGTLLPNAATAGGASFTLTVDGAGFIQGAVVLWNGSPLTTTFVQANELSAAVPASLLAVKGTAAVSVRNPDGSTSNSLTFTIGGQPPSILAVTPSTVQAGAAGFTLTVAGSGFLSGTVVVWNTTNLVTTFGSATQLSAAVPASLVAQAAAVSIHVANPDGTISNALALTVTNPPPSIGGLSQSTALAGGGSFTLTVNGANFLSGALVQWNGASLTTTVVSPTQLTASVTAALIAKAGTAAITVLNPDGQVSGSVGFTIVSPLAITSLSPTAVDAAGAAFTLTVNGAGFLSGAVVDWNGAALATTFVSATQLTAAVTAALIANPGTAVIQVQDPNGPLSPNAAFTIRVPAPPAITFSGPSTAPPATGQTLSFSVGSAYPFPITGQMTLSFQPDVVNPIGTDPAIQFSTGGTSFSFTIAAGSTTVPSIAVQTGSTAGTITVSVQLQSAGQTIPVPDVTIQIPQAAPVIQKVELTQTASGLQVDVTGYATSREVTQAVFQFGAASGVNLTTSGFTVSVTPIFTTWYQDQSSQPYGSQFLYSQTFSAQGNAQSVSSVTVILSNSVGASQPSASN
jgi:hypothetical protein